MYGKYIRFGQILHKEKKVGQTEGLNEQTN